MEETKAHLSQTIPLIVKSLKCYFLDRLFLARSTPCAACDAYLCYLFDDGPPPIELQENGCPELLRTTYSVKSLVKPSDCLKMLKLKVDFPLRSFDFVCLFRAFDYQHLKTKDQVLDVFKQFHALVERQTGKKLKCIRIDNGGEYIGPFDAYCREHGLQHQKTPPKTP
ncbi:putative RNA-directed DNA polymerase [Tanacetum coccineum]